MEEQINKIIDSFLIPDQDSAGNPTGCQVIMGDEDLREMKKQLVELFNKK